MSAMLGLWVFLAAACLVVPTMSYPEQLRIGAFNVQVFGVSKMSKPLVPEILRDIIRLYDVIVIQEIRDKSEVAIYKLLDLVSEGQPEEEVYDLVLSGRLGSSSSKEQYGWFYRKDLLLPNITYNTIESGPEFPNRHPHGVQWTVVSNGFSFEAIAMHIDPDEVMHELAGLGELAFLKREEPLVVFGDLNADCSYLTKSEWRCIRGEDECTSSMKTTRLWDESVFTWLIDDDVDTTTKGTHCAYDRIVVSESLKEILVPQSDHVLRYDTLYNLDETITTRVSDHFPVEFKILTTGPTDWGCDAP